MANRYERVREQAVIREEMGHLWASLAALFCSILAGGGAWYLLTLRMTLPATLASLLLLFFLVSFALSLSSFLNVRAERPASRESIEVLMRLVERSPERDDLKGEIRRLLDEQGDLYQYQVYALILRARQ